MDFCFVVVIVIAVFIVVASAAVVHLLFCENNIRGKSYMFT